MSDQCSEHGGFERGYSEATVSYTGTRRKDQVVDY